jgi:hypothetical protein
MNITQEVNMTFIHNLAIHLYSKTVCYMWVLTVQMPALEDKKNLIISINLGKK